MVGVRDFIGRAIAKGKTYDRDKLRCPCSKCRNRKYPDVIIVEEHLYTYDFVPNYYNWTLHGEDIIEVISQGEEDRTNTLTPEDGEIAHTVVSHLQDMVADVPGPSFSITDPTSNYTDISNEVVDNFYNLFNSGSLPTFEGCTMEIELSIHMKLLHMKSDHELSEPAYNSICGTMRNLIGVKSRIPISYQHSKKLVNELGMGYKRIYVCLSGCIIFYADDEGLENCHFCGEARYKPPMWGDNKKHYK